jgi:hypothetical protein
MLQQQRCEIRSREKVQLKLCVDKKSIAMYIVDISTRPAFTFPSTGLSPIFCFVSPIGITVSPIGIVVSPIGIFGIVVKYFAVTRH